MLIFAMFPETNRDRPPVSYNHEIALMGNSWFQAASLVDLPLLDYSGYTHSDYIFRQEAVDTDQVIDYNLGCSRPRPTINDPFFGIKLNIYRLEDILDYNLRTRSVLEEQVEVRQAVSDYYQSHNTDFSAQSNPDFIILDNELNHTRLVIEHHRSGDNRDWINTATIFRTYGLTPDEIHTITAEYLSWRHYDRPEVITQPELPAGPAHPTPAPESVTLPTESLETDDYPREAVLNQVKANKADLWMQAAATQTYQPLDNGFFVNGRRVEGDPEEPNGVLFRSGEPRFLFLAESARSLNSLRLEVGSFDDWMDEILQNNGSEWTFLRNRINRHNAENNIDLTNDQVVGHLIIDDPYDPERRYLIEREEIEQVGWTTWLTTLKLTPDHPVAPNELRQLINEVVKEYPAFSTNN